MRALFDFQCNLGHTTEKYIDTEITEIECPFCLGNAEKMLSAPRQFKVDGFPSGIDGDQWARVREKNARRARERDE